MSTIPAIRDKLNEVTVVGREVTKVIIPPKLTIKQATAYLGLSPKFLFELRKAEEGPPYYQFRRKILYPLDELVAWREEHRREA